MSAVALLHHAQAALLLSIALALPIVAVAAIVGLFVAALQAASQIQDPTLAHLPRIVAVALALVVLSPWMARELSAFTERMFLLAAR